MKRVRSFVLCLCVCLYSFASAHAAEATPDGVSIDVGLESYHDNTVAQVGGGNLHDQTFYVGAGALGNYGDLAFGVAVSGRL